MADNPVVDLSSEWGDRGWIK